MCGFYSCGEYVLRERFGEHADVCDAVAVPPGARRISYWTRPLHPNGAYEFDISEEDFLTWAKARGYAVEGITRPFEISTYMSCKTYRMHEHRKVIRDGYQYEWHEEDRALYVAYDAKEERAYVYFHTR